MRYTVRIYVAPGVHFNPHVYPLHDPPLLFSVKRVQRSAFNSLPNHRYQGIGILWIPTIFDQISPCLGLPLVVTSHHRGNPLEEHPMDILDCTLAYWFSAQWSTYRSSMLAPYQESG
jgi:hypothetical protein